MKKLNRIEKRLVNTTQSNRDTFYRIRRRTLAADIRERKRCQLELESTTDFSVDKQVGFFARQERDADIERVVQDANMVISKSDTLGNRTNSKAQLLTGLLDQDSLDLESSYLQLALRKNIVAAVSNYLGEVPVLTKVDVWQSISTPELSSSQLHHCDWAGMKQMKVFIYCTDVDETSGPLTMVSAINSERIRKETIYKYGSYIQDDEVHCIIGQNQEEAIIGRQNTIAFADTSSCFHYGSRVKSGNASRTVVILQYLPIGSFNIPLKFKKGCPYNHLGHEDLESYKQLTLGYK